MDVKLGLDVSQAVSAAAQFIGSMQGTGTALQNVMLKSAEMNSTGDKLNATFKGMSDAGKQVDVQVRKTAQGFEVASIAMKANSDGAGKLTSSWSKFLISAGGAVRILEAMTIKSLFGSLIGELQTAAQRAAEFQVRISEIRTISQDNQISFAGWSQEIRKISDSFGMAQTDVAAAAYDALSNQVAKGAESFIFLEKSAEFAKVTVSSLADSQNLISSAIKGFGMSVGDTERISAEFFKTIDLGRVKANEMANTFGRIAPLARGLGIEFEDVLSTIATLTIQGNRYSDVQTLLTNVFTKLLKPTGEMKNLLSSWGTPTGEAAIATFGFVGVLQKLEEATHGSTTELAGLFNEIRSLKGAAGLTGALGDFQKNKDLIKNSQGSFDVAKQIAFESPGQQLLIEWNKVKNFFVNDIGQSFITTFNSINQTIGGFTDKVKMAAQIIGTMAVGFTVLKTIILVTNITAATYSGTMVRLGLATAGTTTANAAASASFITLRGALVATGWGAAVLAIGLLTEKLIESAQAADRARAAYNQLRNNNPIGKADPNEKSRQQSLEAFNSLTDATYGRALRAVADVTRAVNNNLDQLKTKSIETLEQFSVSSRTFFGVLSERIGDLKKKYNEIKRYIEDSPIRLEKFREDINKSYHDTVMQNANPQQKVEVLQQRIKEVIADINNLGSKADDKSRELLEKRFQELKELYGQRFNIGVDQSKQKGFSQHDSMPGKGGKTLEFKTEEGDAAPSINTKPLFDAYKQLYAFRLQKEQEILAIQKAQEEKIKKQAEQEAERLKKLEDLVKQFANFGVRDEGGNIKPGLKTPTGEVDADKAKKELQDLMDQIKKLSKETGFKGPEYIKYISDLETQAAQIKKTIQAETDKQLLATQQENLKKQEEATKDSYKRLQDELKKISEATFADNQAIDNARKLAEQMKSIAEDGKAMEKFKFTDIFEKGGIAKSQETLRLMELTTAKANELLAKIAELKQAGNQQLIDGQSLPKPQALQDVKLLFEQLIRVNEALSNIKKVDNAADVAQQTKKQIEDLQSALDKVKESQSAMEASQQRLRELGASLTIPLANLKLQYPEITDASNKAVETFQRNNKAMADSFEPLLEQLRKVLERMKAIEQGKAGGQVQGAGPVGDDLPGPEFLATGGIAGMHPGSPRGTDTIPAWLTKGEYVMDAQNTRKFLPQLNMMRLGISPKYYNSGGYVTTTVGDITVNVSSAETNQGTIRNLGHSLRREIRRGTVKLNGE
jgi:TP901 family phage tail tape measure protein